MVTEIWTQHTDIAVCVLTKGWTTQKLELIPDRVK